MTIANSVILSALLFACVLLMVAGYTFRRPAIAFGAAGLWVVTAIASNTFSTVTWDIYYDLFLVCIVFAVVTVLEGIMLRPRNTEPEEDIEPGDSYRAYGDRLNDYQNQDGFSDKLESRRSGTRQRRKKAGKKGAKPDRANREDDFAQTGKL